MQKRPLKIPIELCQDALKSKKVRELQVFVWLKMNSSSKMKITKDVLLEMMTDLNVKSIKTVKAGIFHLQDKKWISKSKKSGYYYIKSFENVRKIECFKRRAAAEFYIKDIRKFKAFLIAAVISQLIAIQKLRWWKSERGKRRSLTSDTPQFFPLANKVLTQVFDISISTAWEWKKLAEIEGYILIRKNFARIDSVQPQFLYQLKKYGGIPTGKLGVQNGQVCEQLPDLVASNIDLKRRKKIDTY